MPVVECKDCKTMVSTSAEVCPRCSAKYPASYTYKILSEVTVHRKKTILSALGKMIITVDGQKVGELKSDEAITFNLPFGDHMLRAHVRPLISKSELVSAKGRVSWDVPSGQVTIRILPARVYRIEARISRRGVDFESYVVENLAENEDFGSLRRFVQDM